MIFLIEFNRPKLDLVTYKTYPDSERTKAQDDRLALELDLLHKGIDHEVVILEAINEEQLRKTHQRYFDSPADLHASARQILGI